MFNIESFRRSKAKISIIAKGLKGIDVSKKVSDVLTKNGDDMRSKTVLSMRNTKLASWWYPRWGGRKKHHPSTPGNPPAMDTGNLIGSLSYDVSQSVDSHKLQFGSIIHKLAYPRWLEEGTSKMDARPWLKPVSDAQEPKIVEDLSEIIPDAIDKVFRR